MARHYEYVIHGPSATIDAPPSRRRKSLSARKDNRRNSSLRILYRDSGDASPTVESTEYAELFSDDHNKIPTTPRLPPTPPTGEEGVERGGNADEDNQTTPEGFNLSSQSTQAKVRSIPVTPVNGNSPPTPDDTPPRELPRLPTRPFLSLRPSMASTHAESFRTAREHLFSEHGSTQASPELPPTIAFSSAMGEPASLSIIMESESKIVSGASQSQVHASLNDASHRYRDLPEEADAYTTADAPNENKDTPETQFMFRQTDNAQKVYQPVPDRMSPQRLLIDKTTKPISTAHHQVTTSNTSMPVREKSLRDRLDATDRLPASASTEAFANVIGWNDGVSSGPNSNRPVSKRWSGQSNPSAVEAYVVESPIKPRKWGTLRKVVKNDSLRSTSSPMPKSNRTSLQSAGDSVHRLVHKQQKLGNQNRWSVGSEISKRSSSWGSSPTWQKQDVIRVAVIPERQSSLQTSTASSSRRHSRSVSITPGMPPTATHGPRRKRAFSDSYHHSPSSQKPPQIPVRGSSLSAPTSRSGSRANSVTSHQVYIQREQAEKDLRSTLERMESERLSASIGRDSDQSAQSPSPAPRQPRYSGADRDQGAHQDSQRSQFLDEAPALPAIEIESVTPGTKDWADLRPATLAGTPFSQASVLSTSPEIIEARVINYFPHNNDSVQLIEPNRLSETSAVKALREQNQRGANTILRRDVQITTPRISNGTFVNQEIVVDSPLRNPRRPPDPPESHFAVLPPTPRTEGLTQFETMTDHSAVPVPRTETTLRKRPVMRDNVHSESFIRTLSRGLSLRNARNPKANQELDGTLHPFWRPRAFWDDDDYRLRSQQEGAQRSQENDVSEPRSVVIATPDQPLTRSNTIATGPMSLVRRFSEKRRQKKIVDEHILQQQALVRQASYSSLQRLRAGHKLFGLYPVRTLSLNAGIGRMSSLRERMTTIKARRDDEKRELRREKLRKSIGVEVVPQSDSRFPTDGLDSTSHGMTIEHFGGRKLDEAEVIEEMLRNAQAETMVEKRGLRL